MNFLFSQTWPAQREGESGHLLASISRVGRITQSNLKSNKVNVNSGDCIPLNDRNEEAFPKVLHAEVLMAHSTYRRSGNTHRKIQRHSSLKSKDAKRKQQELNFDPHALKRKWKNKVSFLVRPKTQSARSALVTTFK